MVDTPSVAQRTAFRLLTLAQVNNNKKRKRKKRIIVNKIGPGAGGRGCQEDKGGKTEGEGENKKEVLQ